jgi:predicted RNase H-like HicB family nuclease
MAEISSMRNRANPAAAANGLGCHAACGAAGAPACGTSQVLSVGHGKTIWPFCGSSVLFPAMKAQFTYWKESDGKYLGYLNSYPEHWTQGEDLDDLKEHLRDLLEMFSAEDIPGIRKVAELEVA